MASSGQMTAMSHRVLPLAAVCLLLSFIRAPILDFAAPASCAGSPQVGAAPRSTSLAGSASTATPVRSNGAPQGHLSASICGVAAVLTAVGLAVSRGKQSASKVRCNAFGSSSSSFMGCSTVTATVMQLDQEPEQSWGEPTASCCRSGLAGMLMRGQVWWWKHTGKDETTGGKIQQSARRESIRRGEELFLHDTSNFELTLHNIFPGISSSGRADKRHLERGRYGKGGPRGQGVRGGGKPRDSQRRHYEGGHQPIQMLLPKLTLDQVRSMKYGKYAYIDLHLLNMCADDEEVFYQDLVVRGFSLKQRGPNFLTPLEFHRVKVRCSPDDEFKVKNLTVYAHEFEPDAREKIERNGGRCIRLHDITNLPLLEENIKSNVDFLQDLKEVPDSSFAAKDGPKKDNK